MQHISKESLGGASGSGVVPRGSSVKSEVKKKNWTLTAGVLIRTIGTVIHTVAEHLLVHAGTISARQELILRENMIACEMVWPSVPLLLPVNRCC